MRGETLPKELAEAKQKLLLIAYLAATPYVKVRLPVGSVFDYATEAELDTYGKSITFTIDPVPILTKRSTKQWENGRALRWFLRDTAGLTKIFKPFVKKFHHGELTVYLKGEGVLFHTELAGKHCIIAHRGNIALTFDQDPGISIISSLSDVELWKKALEEFGL